MGVLCFPGWYPCNFLSTLHHKRARPACSRFRRVKIKWQLEYPCLEAKAWSGTFATSQTIPAKKS